jgi:putative ABC transport system permease protein
MSFLADLKFALRSLLKVKGLSITVILTLALGIGANAAIFSLVRGVLLRPLVNRDEDRLIYIRQSAPGVRVENAAFSVPEIIDLKARVKTLTAIGDFSTIGFTMVGLGEPRQVRAGVVSGTYFEVMGLHPVMGRLIGPGDDGPNADGVAVLTYRFWSDALKKDPTVLGKTIRLGRRTATVIGVLEPCVPYPAETELIANVVTSPHHLSATMVTGREHRMTELFGRLAPGATLESAKAELQTVHAGIVKEHPETYPAKSDFRINAVKLRDQITSRARTVLWVLLAASGLMFIVACSNVANLILARSVRREGELAIRAALGAGTGALRRTLLAESVLLCAAGAALGVVAAGPMVSVLGRYAARFSIRALDVTLDSTLLWVGVLLALISAVLLAFVPRLPSGQASSSISLSNGSARATGTANRRLQAFAVVQIAASFVMLAGAGALLKTLMTLQAANPGFETRNVLAVDVPVLAFGKTPDQVKNFYREVRRRAAALPGVDQVALANSVPWRDAGNTGPGFSFSVEGRVRENGEEDPRAKFRSVSPGFFAALGVPILAGRDFTDADTAGAEKVVIVSQSFAQRFFSNQNAVNGHMLWTDSVMKFIGVSPEPRRIVGVIADLDDENVQPSPTFMVYHPAEQEFGAGRLLVHTRSDPYALVPVLTKSIRELERDQPVERASTLEDVRAEVLAPNRLNTIVFGGFAAVALAIAVVGVAGVLAFSVSGRIREFGVRLAIGSQPRHILTGVLSEGTLMAGIGVVAGALGGYALARVVGSMIPDVQVPGALPILGAAVILLAAALIASLLPAARAARVDVMEALRAE